MSPLLDTGASIFSAYDRFRKKERGGSTRFPRIQLPGSAQRSGSRIYFPKKCWPRVWHPGHRLFGLPINNIVKARYVRKSNDARRHVNDWLRYVQERERSFEEPERKFFDNKRSQIERDEVKQELLANQGEDIAFYKVLLSPKQNELDHETYTREIMTRWEELTGITTNWYAVKHANTQYHHVHLVMPGLDVDGNPYRLNRDDLNLMRELANEYQYEIQDRAYQYEKTIDHELGTAREQLDKFLERREGDDLMRELGVTSKELEEAVKDLLPPTNFDDIEFRNSLEELPIITNQSASKEPSIDNPILDTAKSTNEVDYVSPMEWSEHFAHEEIKESISRERDAGPEQERDERDEFEF